MKLILAKPRGFCAGVERAIKCVEEALERFGAPVYVLNDIVHNSHVVSDLRSRGAVFVKDLKDVPPGSHLLFSAHGVSPERYKEAEKYDMHVVDATCPLVEKVHNEARRFAARDYTIVLIGEQGHDETIGTMGWAPKHIKRVLTVEDVAELEIEDTENISYITQTTLSVEDCNRVIDALKARFPHIVGPPTEDICYATTNRQAAIASLSPEADLILVVGDVTSGNSNRLVDTSRARGKAAYLISSEKDIKDAWLEGIETIVLTAGASAPEGVVQCVVEHLKDKGVDEVEEAEYVPENVHFKLPKTLAAKA